MSNVSVFVSSGQSVDGKTLTSPVDSSGNPISGYYVLNGGTMANDVFVGLAPSLVDGGGSVFNDTLSSTGLNILGPNVAQGMTVDLGGSLADGTANDAQVTLLNTTINSGGTVLNFGTVDGVTVNQGGTLTDAGAQAGGAPMAFASGVVVDGGTFFEEGSGTGTVVNAGGSEDILGGVAVGTTVMPFGVLGLHGTAISTTLLSGAFAGGYGYDSATRVLAGATMSMGGGASAFSTTVSGSLFISASGGSVSAVGTTVGSGGSLTMLGYSAQRYFTTLSAVLSDTVLEGGASMVLSGTTNGFATASGTTIDSGASATMSNGGTLADTTLSGGSASLLSGGSAVGFLDFASGGGVVVSGGAVFSATVGGLNTSGSVIDLRGLADVSGGATASLNTATGLLTVSGDSASVGLQLAAGSYAGAVFSALADGRGGTIVEMACFARGTRIRAEAGEVPVEALVPGARVALARGGFAPVVWVGHRRVDCTRHPRPETVWPVRVAAGAFGPGVPARALWLSPDHAVFVGGVLVPIRYLLDGEAIARVRCDTVEYWHVELPAHDVILAEGMAAESFLDTGNRDAFVNGGGVTGLHADFAQRAWDADACAPLAIAGPALERARALVARQRAAPTPPAEAGKRGQGRARRAG